MKPKTKMLLISAVFSLSLAAAAPADLAKQIDKIITQPSQKNVEFSIHILKPDGNKTVYTHNANLALVPASNMKIIVTAAALRYLGPDYQYKTEVGLCDDKLVIIGSGDPLLGDRVTDAAYGRAVGWIFQDIAEKLKKNGIKTIKDIIVDTTVFDDQRVHPNWPRNQLNKWFACEVSGLNYNDNCIEMTAKNTADKVVVSIEPKTSFIKIINQVVPVKQGSSAVGAYRQLEKPNTLIVKGKCKTQEGPFDVAIERPPAFFGYLLAENLLAAGIRTEGQLLEKAVDEDCDFEQLAQYSTPITDCLKRSNKNSLGLVAEALVKTIAAHSQGGTNGSWKKGQQLISRYLLELGIEKSEFYVDDGSGLSRQNELSANAVTKVVSELYKSRNWRLYKDSLAVGGVDGTIRKYFREEKYKAKVFGKTGYIAGVKSFSGLCSTANGDYIFSILANNANARTRAAINNIVKTIIDDADQVSSDLSDNDGQK
ncbi:MAG: D-alanyl-D-alanine carboxypeptidase/D-alanyl-D-alanine endopeptidase [Planctomycetota bacterium]|jgi:D-alanyl-D-alanine carboxypeptidase/D-alanyl-D-alanine-endopeptidase (penicillin-binding protein 4)